jgi:O-antigen/teichoic acid export membrane protein
VDFGHYITITSLIFIVAGLTEAGLTTVGVREYTVREAENRDRFLRNLVGMRTVLTLIGVLGALAFSLAAGYERVLVLGTLVAGAGLVLSNLQYTYSVPLSVDLRLGWLAVIDFLRQGTTAALNVALVVAGAALLPFYAVAIVTSVVALALTVGLVRRRTSLRPAADIGEWVALLRDTLPYAAATALGVVYFRVAVILMSLIASKQETGYFSASFRIIELVSSIPWLLVTSAFPVMARAARDDQHRLRYALQRLFDVSLIAGAWIALVIGVGAEFAIEVVGGSRFGPSADVLRVLGFAMLGTFLVATWGYALLSLRRHVALLCANALALVVGVVSTLLLVPAHGALGAGIATTATELTLAVTYLTILVRLRPDLRVSPRLIPPVVVATAVAAIPAVMLDVHDVVKAAVATALFVAALAAQRAIPGEVLSALRLR